MLPHLPDFKEKRNHPGKVLSIDGIEIIPCEGLLMGTVSLAHRRTEPYNIFKYSRPCHKGRREGQNRPVN